MDDEVMVFRRPSLPNLDDLARSVATALRSTPSREPAPSDKSCTSGSVHDDSCSSESKPQEISSGVNVSGCAVTSAGPAQCRYHGLRSVAFDSRFAYPTAADFIDPSVIPSYDDFIAVPPVAAAGVAHIALRPPTPAPPPLASLTGASSTVHGRNSVSPVAGSSRTSVLSSEGRARKPSAKDLLGTGLPMVFPLPAPAPAAPCAQPQVLPLATAEDAVQVSWNEASAEEKVVHPPSHGNDFTSALSHNRHNHAPVPEQECSNEMKPASMTVDAPTASRHGFDFSLSACNLGSLSQERFRAAALAIQQEFGLSLFGFDVIVPTTNVAQNASQGGRSARHSNGASQCVAAERARSPSSGSCGSIDEELGFSLTLDQAGSEAYDLVVIDVNYFPSYKEVPDFPQRLRKFLRKKAGMS